MPPFGRRASSDDLGHGKVETEPVDDAVVARAAAALPFVRSPGGAEVVPFPPLSLEQYASLRAELSVWPERWAAILLRYHVVDELRLDGREGAAPGLSLAPVLQQRRGCPAAAAHVK